LFDALSTSLQRTTTDMLSVKVVPHRPLLYVKNNVKGQEVPELHDVIKKKLLRYFLGKWKNISINHEVEPF
jgi:hypothetical protein